MIMKISESQIRKIVRGVLSEQPDYGYSKPAPSLENYVQRVMRDFESSDSPMGLTNDLSTLWYEWEVSSPERMKMWLESVDFHEHPEMPIEYYQALVTAVKKFEDAVSGRESSVYTPGWRD